MTSRPGLGPSMESTAPHLYKLPLEILYYVVEDLEPEDLFDLARCSRHLNGMLKDESMCRFLLLTKAAKATETIEAAKNGNYCRALRRLVKRRRAYAEADPYAVGTLGLVQSYFYKDGIVCYTSETHDRNWIRILDLCNSMRSETVIEMPYLLGLAGVPFPECLTYKVSILYHSHEITSCLCAPKDDDQSRYLLVFNAKEERLIYWEVLESRTCLFIRNNASTLVYGSLERDSYGSKRWILNAYDVVEEKLSEKRILLSNLRGYDVGQDVSFEIIDGYFYGVCNKTRGEDRDPTWSSYYYAFRFPVDNFDGSEVEIVSKEDSWRRDQREGPIDDRWGVLDLQQDESSGLPRIVEIRKEWLTKRSGHQRTCYMKELTYENTRSGLQVLNVATNPHHLSRTNKHTRNSEDFQLDSDMIVRHRQEENVHSGDDSSDPVILTRSKTYFSDYQHSSRSFLDMYDDDDDRCAGDTSTQHLRLRVGTRRPLEPVVCRDTESSANNTDGQRTYSNHKVRVWPEPSDATSSKVACDTNNVTQILNPHDYQGPATVTGDERVLVYTLNPLPGSTCKLKTLIFVSFDPATRLLTDPSLEDISIRSLQSSPLSDLSTIKTWKTPKDSAPPPRSRAEEEHTGPAVRKLESQQIPLATTLTSSKSPERTAHKLVTGSQQSINAPSWSSVQEPQYYSFPGRMWLGYNATSVVAESP